jgi:hypothetical protein
MSTLPVTSQGGGESAVVPIDRDFGERLRFIEESVAVLGAKLEKLTTNDIVSKDAFSSLGHEIDMRSQLDDVATRLNRIELLLLRTPLPDFRILDDAIATLLPQPKVTEGTDNVISINPEFIDQFYVNSPPDSPTEATQVYRADLRCTPLIEECVCAARCCNGLPRSEDNYGRRLDDIDWYTCPCCDALCCSLACYSNHCKDCIKHFYIKQQAPEKSTYLREEERSPLNHMDKLDTGDLEDLEDSDQGEDALNDDTLQEGRLEQLVAKAESGDLNIDDLTDEEVRCFHTELKTGSLDCAWSSWEPWWHRKAPVIGEDGVASPRASRACALKPPGHICCPEGRKPHESVAFTALSALYAYVHTMRAYNGGWEWAPVDAANHLLHLCPAICGHQVFSSASTCLLASLESAATLPGGGFGATYDRLCLADAHALIIGGADNCACALQDAVDIFEACLAGGGGERLLRRGVKKLEFLTSFAFYHLDLLQPLAVIARDFAEEPNSQMHTNGGAATSDFGSIAAPGMD